MNLAEDVFKLQHLLDCHILQHRDDIEEITAAAVKEEQIEGKLAGIESDWAAMNLVRHAVIPDKPRVPFTVVANMLRLYHAYSHDLCISTVAQHLGLFDVIVLQLAYEATYHNVHCFRAGFC